MSSDIPTLLRRNLHDVFGEADRTRRRLAIDEIFAEDAVFYAPDGRFEGRAAIDRIAGEIRENHPEFRYTELAEPEVLQNAAGRVQWVSGPPDKPPVYAGTDFIVVRNGRIAAVYLFFDPLPV